MKYDSNIESIGVKLPDKKLTTEEILEQVKVDKIRLELFTGIKERHICSSEENAITLSVDAVNDCFKYSNYVADDIELLICCSISKYGEDRLYIHEPSLASEIASRTGINNAFSFDITNACAGMLTGINIANQFISNGRIKKCMIVSGEYISNICLNAIPMVNSISHPELASLTVGDAGAAVLIERSKNKSQSFEAFKFVTLSRYSDLCNGKLSKISHGAYMETQMKKIHDVSISKSIPIVKEVLESIGLKFNDINYLIPHQTSKNSIVEGGRIYSSYFGSKPENIVINLKYSGNTASTTHFVAMYKYLKERKFKKGDRLMLLSFASGLEIGVTIFKMFDLIDKYGNKD